MRARARPRSKIENCTLDNEHGRPVIGSSEQLKEYLVAMEKETASA